MLIMGGLFSASCDDPISEPESIPVTGVSLSHSSIVLAEDDEMILTATVSPSDASNKKITWRSSDNSVVSVTDGKVTACKVGTATITVITDDGGKSAKCQVTVVPKTVPVTSVSLDKTSIEIEEGYSETLTAAIHPDNATNKKLNWTSSDKSVAIVSDGKVVAQKAGTATITVTTEDGNKTATCEVTVIPRTVPVWEIVLDKNSVEMVVGDDLTLTVTVTPENATDKTVTWSSSNSNVAKVEDGTVTALSVGNAVITAQCGSVKAECFVTVNPVEASSVTLDRTSATLTIGETFTLTATVFPENTTDKTIIWSSSDFNVAKVENGKVTALSVGNAVITAQCGSVKAECYVTVNPIEVSSITLDRTSATLSAGEAFTLTATVTPENATDKTIIWSSSDSNIAKVEDGTVTALSVGNAVITAQCGSVKAECSVTVNPIEASSITLDRTSATLSAGEAFTLMATVTPENATYKTIIWSSSDSNVAKVENGQVTAMSVGNAVITAQCGSVKAECFVTVNPVEVSSIILDRMSATLSAGETLTLTATVTPDNATDKTVTWSSSNNNVATVVDGTITAVSVGKATITVRTNNGLSSSCQIDVIKRPASGGSEGTGEIEW